MSVFSEQNARLAQGLVDAKTAIEAKKGSVVVAKTTPQIEEIVAGISTVKAGGGASAGGERVVIHQIPPEVSVRKINETQTSIPLVHTLEYGVPADYKKISYSETYIFADSVATGIS